MCCLRNPGSTVTLKDVAKAAEVSVATVSRVINRSGNVSVDTTTRVLSAIKTLNYSPNAYAIQLRGLRHRSPLSGGKMPVRNGFPGHRNSTHSDLEILRSQNKKLKRAVRTLIRDLERWQSLAEDSIESA